MVAVERRRQRNDDEVRWFVSSCEHALPLFGLYLPTSPRFCVSPSLLLRPAFSLSVALVISIRPLLSPSLRTAEPRLLPSSLASFLTLGERILSTTLPSPPHFPIPCLVLSRQPHRFTFYVPPAVSLALSLSIYLSTFLRRTQTPRYQSVSVPRSVSAFSHRFSRSLPLSLPTRSSAPRFSRSFFRRSTTSRSSLR